MSSASLLGFTSRSIDSSEISCVSSDRPDNVDPDLTPKPLRIFRRRDSTTLGQPVKLLSTQSRTSPPRSKRPRVLSPERIPGRNSSVSKPHRKRQKALDNAQWSRDEASLLHGISLPSSSPTGNGYEEAQLDVPKRRKSRLISANASKSHKVSNGPSFLRGLSRPKFRFTGPSGSSTHSYSGGNSVEGGTWPLSREDDVVKLQKQKPVRAVSIGTYLAGADPSLSNSKSRMMEATTSRDGIRDARRTASLNVEGLTTSSGQNLWKESFARHKEGDDSGNSESLKKGGLLRAFEKLDLVGKRKNANMTHTRETDFKFFRRFSLGRPSHSRQGSSTSSTGNLVSRSRSTTTSSNCTVAARRVISDSSETRRWSYPRTSPVGLPTGDVGALNDSIIQQIYRVRPQHVPILDARVHVVPEVVTLDRTATESVSIAVTVVADTLSPRQSERAQRTLSSALDVVVCIQWS